VTQFRGFLGSHNDSFTRLTLIKGTISSSIDMPPWATMCSPFITNAELPAANIGRSFLAVDSPLYDCCAADCGIAVPDEQYVYTSGNGNAFEGHHLTRDIPSLLAEGNFTKGAGRDGAPR
jgi:hypothetical protein